MTGPVAHPGLFLERAELHAHRLRKASSYLQFLKLISFYLAHIFSAAFCAQIESLA
jgi:hypothetical protein